MRMLLWLQACTIAALIVYVLYSKRKSARTKPEPHPVESDKPTVSHEEAVIGPSMDEATLQTPPLSAPNQDEEERTGLLPDGYATRDKELFEHIHQRIINEQLFLDPDFSREHIIRLGLINKNKVALLFRQFAHTNFNGYINTLRLEYALAMMREQPDVPIKAVAYDAGFNSIRTFYRAFEKAYGKTPAEYKDTLAEKPSNKK